MGALGQRIMDDNDDIVVTDETRHRVDTARVRDIAIRLKGLFKNKKDDDIEALASVLIEAQQEGAKATREFVLQRLLDRGIDQQVARDLSGNLPES
jgi:hypothetical protein